MLLRINRVRIKRSRPVTALIFAGENVNEKCVKALIEAGADVNACSNKGNTALALAANKGHYGCLTLLIQAGADVNVSNADGVTALLRAVQIKNAKCLKNLIEAGADVNCKGKIVAKEFDIIDLVGPPTDVHMSIKYRGITLVPTSKPDDCYSTTLHESDITPLMLAPCVEDPRLVDLLLKAGANVNEKNSLGTTALSIAIKRNAEPCVKLL